VHSVPVNVIPGLHKLLWYGEMFDFCFCSHTDEQTIFDNICLGLNYVIHICSLLEMGREVDDGKEAVSGAGLSCHPWPLALLLHPALQLCP